VAVRSAQDLIQQGIDHPVAEDQEELLVRGAPRLAIEGLFKPRFLFPGRKAEAVVKLLQYHVNIRSLEPVGDVLGNHGLFCF
jgi:hypothetical protein